MAAKSAKSAKPHKIRETVFDVDVERLADLYARAGLDAAGDPDAQQALCDELESLVTDILNVRPEFEEMFRSELISHDQKLQMLDRVFGGAASHNLLNLLKVMVRHGRLGVVRAVAQSAHKILDERIGRVPVIVVTALPLDDALLNELADALRAALDAEPVIESRVDPDLLAGFVVRAGDRVFDASARTNLKRARRQMIHNAFETIQSRPEQFMEQTPA